MTQRELILIIGMALVTFLVRYPILVLVTRIPLPATILNAMRYIPPAVLTAIIVPAILIPDGKTLDLHVQNSYLIASIVAALVAWRSKNLLLTIGLGMATLWLWRWLLMLSGAV
ncbi:MAG: AzlD domain-containing protein [Chloroflexi bacterium]|nr:AzlD domain-containing protein [Chloroflexota bacterium]